MIVDYNELVHDCEFRSEVYRMQHDSERLVHEKQCATAIAKLLERAEKAEKERDAAICDMEALMWHSGDGCEICEHKIVEQRHPYTKLGCRLGSGCECNPKWCGPDKEE